MRQCVWRARWQLVVMFLVFVAPESDLHAQQKILETLRSWRSGLHGTDIVGEVKTLENGNPGLDIIEEVYLSKDDRTCVARRYVIAQGIRTPTDIFGVVANQHLSAQWNFIESGDSGGVLSDVEGENIDSACLFLNMFAARHLFLRSLEIGTEMLPVIESRNDWATRETGQELFYKSGEGDGELLLTVRKDKPAWPVSITYKWATLNQSNRFSTQLELRFSDPTLFAGIEQELPGLTIAKMQMAGDFKANFEEVFKLVSVKKRLKEVKSWPDALTEMPNGLPVTVKHLPQIEFEWQNNDIVRSLDRKKLSELAAARFAGSTRVWVLVGALLISIVAVILFSRRR